MQTPRIRTSHSGEPMQAESLLEYNWLHEHRQELYERYGECIVLLYQQRVLGHGSSLGAAMEEAEANLDPQIREVIHPVIGFVYPSSRPTGRYRLSPKSET